ncbi:phosphatase PAP2 family protein [Fontivita pretiosa]|uniref:phosphatase PAP2 family protein n=1 Tax=Fontivita pretiosa TaxID=2989684 RepID=UPI003D180BCC
MREPRTPIWSAISKMNNAPADMKPGTVGVSISKARIMHGSSRQLWLISLWMTGLVAIAATIDLPVARWTHEAIPVSAPKWALKLMKSPGHFGFTLIVAAMLILWHPLRWRAAGLVCASGIISGALCALMKWCVGRTRPLHGVAPFTLHPFIDGLRGLFEARNLSFPSGHATLAFATAAALATLLPNWRLAFWLGAALVALERILQGSHYPSDVVAAAALGVVSVHITLLADDLLHRP